jgi:hypothetical protein
MPTPHVGLFLIPDFGWFLRRCFHSFQRKIVGIVRKINKPIEIKNFVVFSESMNCLKK